MAWDDAMNYMGLGNIANAYKKQAIREQTDLERDLYARGYRGVPTDEIHTKRGGLGSLLQSAGILGEPDPEPMTEYQKFIVDQGARGRQEEDLDLEGKRLNLSHAKGGARYDAIRRAKEAFEASGIVSPEMVSDYPELADDYGGMIKTSKRERARKISEENADIKHKKIYNRYLMQGVLGTRAGGVPANKRAVDMYNSWARSPDGAALLAEITSYVGNSKDPVFGVGKLDSAPSDPVEEKMFIQDWVGLKRKIRESMTAAQVDPRLIESYIAHLPTLKGERDPNMVFGDRPVAVPSPMDIPAPSATPSGKVTKDDLDSFLDNMGRNIGQR